MYIVYASWFLFLRGALKQALPAAPKEKVDKHVEDDNPVHEPVEEKKVERIEDEKEDVTTTEGVEDTKNEDQPMVSKNDGDEKDVLDQDKVAEADVVQSLMEPKPSVMNWNMFVNYLSFSPWQLHFLFYCNFVNWQLKTIISFQDWNQGIC